MDNLLKKIDIFGVSLSINFRGKEKTGTKVGGVCSIFAAVAMLLFLGTLTMKLVLKETTLVGLKTMYHDFDTMEPLSAKDALFEMAFRVMDQNFIQVEDQETYFSIQVS